MRLFYFVCVLISLFSCKDVSKKEQNNPIDLQIDQVYKTGGGMGQGNDKHVDMADHYLILKEYSEDDVSSWDDFIEFADKYRDTVQTTLPLKSITIVKPYKITTNLSGGKGWQEFREHCLLTVNYSYQTMHEKLADIESLIFYQNGEARKVDLLTDQRKKKLTGYFDSNGNYSEKWWDRYKDQVPVDYEIDSVRKIKDKH